jgi:hypothetical protein
VSCSHLARLVHYEFSAYLKYVTDVHKYVCRLRTVMYLENWDLYCVYVGYLSSALGRSLFLWDVAHGTGRLAPNILRKLCGIVFTGQNATDELTH